MTKKVKQRANGRAGDAYKYPAPARPIPTRQDLLDAGINIAIGIPMERTLTDWAFHHFWQIARRGWPLIDHVYGARTSTATASVCGCWITLSSPMC